MKVFPKNNYEFELTKGKTHAISELQKNTYITDSLTSQWTKKAFIGQVNENGFKIISSKRGRGAFCILEGKLKSQNGILEIRIHKAFRVMLSIVYLFPLIGFLIALFTKGKKIILSLIVPTLMSLIVFRFIFTEIAFRLMLKSGLNKLAGVIGIKKLKKRGTMQYMMS